MPLWKALEYEKENKNLKALLYLLQKERGEPLVVKHKDFVDTRFFQHVVDAKLGEAGELIVTARIKTISEIMDGILTHPMADGGET